MCKMGTYQAVGPICSDHSHCPLQLGAGGAVSPPMGPGGKAPGSSDKNGPKMNFSIACFLYNFINLGRENDKKMFIYQYLTS